MFISITSFKFWSLFYLYFVNERKLINQNNFHSFHTHFLYKKNKKIIQKTIRKCRHRHRLGMELPSQPEHSGLTPTEIIYVYSWHFHNFPYHSTNTLIYSIFFVLVVEENKVALSTCDHTELRRTLINNLVLVCVFWRPAINTVTYNFQPSSLPHKWSDALCILQ